MLRPICMPTSFKVMICRLTVALPAALPFHASSQTRPPSFPPADLQAIFDAHNSYRAKHCVPPLTWSSELAASSQHWANRCDFNHDEDSPHGENLFWGTAGAYSQQAVAASWYEEIEVYNFAAPSLNDDTGHFTQVIWRSSKMLGCARATCSGNDFWVCRYAPAGNDEVRLKQNVSRFCR
jgi:uncharacterized protein YkwD